MSMTAPTSLGAQPYCQMPQAASATPVMSSPITIPGPSAFKWTFHSFGSHSRSSPMPSLARRRMGAAALPREGLVRVGDLPISTETVSMGRFWGDIRPPRGENSRQFSKPYTAPSVDSIS